MGQFSKESYLAYKRAADAGERIPPDRVAELEGLYQKALEAGEMDKKTAALFDQFVKRSDGIQAHVRDTAVPRTNNDSERPLRPLKKLLDVSGCFRSAEMARVMLDFRTVIDTANRRSVNFFTALEQILGGNTGYLVTLREDPSLGGAAKRMMETHRAQD